MQRRRGADSGAPFVEPMNATQTIVIRTEFDVFIARQHVRELARAAGLDLTNQACIALATSSLARALRLGEVYQGQVSIDCLHTRGNRGIRVICTALEGAKVHLSSRAFSHTRWLVDELSVERTPSSDVQATAVKWAVQRHVQTREFKPVESASQLEMQNDTNGHMPR